MLGVRYFEPAKRLGGRHDGHIVKDFQIKQVKIASDYKIGARRNNTSEHVIIIRITTDRRG